jgi:hypothetical protein
MTDNVDEKTKLWIDKLGDKVNYVGQQVGISGGLIFGVILVIPIFLFVGPLYIFIRFAEGIVQGIYGLFKDD